MTGMGQAGLPWVRQGQHCGAVHGLARHAPLHGAGGDAGEDVGGAFFCGASLLCFGTPGECPLRPLRERRTVAPSLRKDVESGYGSAGDPGTPREMNGNHTRSCRW